MILRGDADAVVGHVEAVEASLLLAPHLNPQRPLLAPKLDRILYQVGEHLANAGSVGVDSGQRLLHHKLHPRLLQLDGQLLLDLPQQNRHVYLLSWPYHLPNARQFQQLADERIHVGHVGLDAIQVVLALVAQLIVEVLV